MVEIGRGWRPDAAAGRAAGAATVVELDRDLASACASMLSWSSSNPMLKVDFAQVAQALGATKIESGWQPSVQHLHAHPVPSVCGAGCDFDQHFMLQRK